MKPEVKKLWVNALRSGDYKQGKIFLHSPHSDGDEFCCLGVLCVLAVKHMTSPIEVTVKNSQYEYDGNSTSLPDSVQKWAGLDDAMPLQETDHCLITMNDGEQKSFDEIADVIEEKL